MVSMAQCKPYVGQWVRFRTPYGEHTGYVERITPTAMIVLSPRREIPVQLARDSLEVQPAKDLTLAWWGGAGGWGAPGYGYGYGFGPYGGWARWAVSFLIIYALWGLLWW
ncbi:MAG: hypothetical protein IRZ10_06480 [Thermoflavifilum sp.]|nr:hypothetical protein [Thermoflavifilum sp.]MCL6514052.1 hypothetical protein [Alicyclobacillus sp.]